MKYQKVTSHPLCQPAVVWKQFSTLIEDVLRNSQCEFSTLSLGSILYGPMEHELHWTRNDGRSLFASRSFYGRDGLWRYAKSSLFSYSLKMKEKRFSSLKISKVFLEEPCLLRTVDVQAAFVHLAIKNDHPRFIPAMNQRLYHNKISDGSRLHPQQISQRRKTYLETIGLKEISLNLAIPERYSLVKILLFSFVSNFERVNKNVFSSFRTAIRVQHLTFAQWSLKFKFTAAVKS